MFDFKSENPLTRTDENNEPIRFRTESGAVYNYDPSLGADLNDETKKGGHVGKGRAVTVAHSNKEQPPNDRK